MSAYDDELVFLLIALGGRLSRLEQHVLEQLPVALTYRQYRLLARVAEGHHTPQVLASFANLTLPTISESITVLVRRGLLTRTTSPTDRRAVLVHVTAEGKKALKAADDALRVAFTEVMRDLETEADKRVAYEQLSLLHTRAGEFFPPPLTTRYSRPGATPRRESENR